MNRSRPSGYGWSAGLNTQETLVVRSKLEVSGCCTADSMAREPGYGRAGWVSMTIFVRDFPLDWSGEAGGGRR